jgi:hypothetical protein
MAIGAKNFKVVGAVVERIAVNVVNMERTFLGYGVYFIPATLTAFVPRLFK